LSRNVGTEIPVYAVENPKTAHISFCQTVYTDLQFATVRYVHGTQTDALQQYNDKTHIALRDMGLHAKCLPPIPLYINVYPSSQKAIGSKQKVKAHCIHYGRLYLPSWNETYDNFDVYFIIFFYH